MWPQKKPFDPLGFLRVGNIVQPARGANTVQPQNQAPKPQQKPQLPSQFSALNRPTVQNQVQRTVNPNQQPQQQPVTAPFRQPAPQRIIAPAPVRSAMPQNTITPTVTPKPVTIAPPPRVTTPRPAPKPVAPQRNPIQQFGDFAGKVNDATFGTVARVGTDIAKSTASFGQRAATTVGQAAVGVYGAGDTLASKIQGQNFAADQKSRNYTKMIQDMGNGTAIDGGKTGFISNESMAGKASPTQFAKEFINAGVETSNLVPAGRVLSGVQKAAGFSKPMVKEILATNAKQAGVFGTATTANDKLQGREVNAQSLAMNYGAPFLLGSASEFGGATARGVAKGVENAQQAPHIRTLQDPAVQDVKAHADLLFQKKQSLLDGGLSPTSPAVKQLDNAIRNTGKLYNDTYKTVYEAQTQGGSVPAGMFDPTGGRLGKKPDVSTMSPQDEIRAIYKKANANRNGKLTISEENRIAELQREPNSTTLNRNEPKTTETEPNSTQPAPQKSVRLDNATDEGKSLAGFLEKSQENLPKDTIVTIKYQPSGTQDVITVQGKVKTSYGGRFRNDKYTSTVGGKTTAHNNYSAEGRTIVTDSNGNNHLINNMDMKSVETHDPSLTAGLTAIEKEIARMNGISEVDFAKQKATTTPKQDLIIKNGEGKAMSVEPKQEGGTLRPDQKPTPYENNVWQGQIDPERAKRMQSNADEMKAWMKSGKSKWAEKSKPTTEVAKAPKEKKMPREQFNVEAMKIRDNLKAGEKGYIKDGDTTYEISRDTKRATPVAKPTLQDALEGKSTKIAPKEVSPTANSYAHEATPDEILNDTVDYWYKHGKETKGGQLIDTTGVNDAYGSGMKRISEHNQFYSDFYKEFKRAPTKKDYADEIERQLQSGGGSMVEPDMATAYQLAKTRKAETDALTGLQDTTDYSVAFDNNIKTANAANDTMSLVSSRKLAGKSTKVKAQPNQKVGIQHSPSAKSTQPAQQASTVSSESQANPKVIPDLGKSSSVEIPRTTGQTQRTPGLTATGTPKLRLGQSYTDSIQPKQSAVKDTKRALAGQERTTYGLRDSFDAGDSVPSDLKQALGAFGNERTVRSNKELWQTAQQRVGTDPVGAMDFFQKTNSDEAVAVGYSLINRYMKQGNVKEAGNIAMDMAERALEAGRTTQAYALMKRLTPEGQIAYVEKKVSRYLKQNPKDANKVKWNDEARKTLYDMADQVNKMPEGRERNLLIGKMQQTVDNIFPSSIVDKAITVWKAGLLTSLRTHERNILGNTINLMSEQAATLPASIADDLMAFRTGKKSIVASVRGGTPGARTGAQIAKDQITTGIDVTNSNMKYNLNHITWNDNKVEKALKGFTETVFRPLGAEDKIFKETSRSMSIRNQATTAAINKNLTGQSKKDFIENFIKDPTAKVMEIADEDSARATFTHDNFLGDIIKNAKSAVRRSNKPGSKAASAALDILMPFTQVPSGVASQLYAYSPAKLIKSSYDIGKVLITGDAELQRTAAQGFGRSVIGTSLLGAGAYLASIGLMTGQPRDDAEKAQWEAQGIPKNSIKVGDRWYSLGSIGPQVVLALAGGQMVSDAETNGKDPVVLAGALASNIGKNFKDQTFLKGMSSALDAVDDPKRYAQSYIEGQATSVIPNIVKDLARAFDPNSRQTNGIIDKAKSSVPGFSNTLPERKDSYGQTIKNDGALEMIDLFNSSKEKYIPEAKYVEALRNSTGLKEQIPTKADRSIEINGEMRKLTSQEQSDYQNYIGTKGKQVIGELSKDTEFAKLGDEEKVKIIDKALKDINSAAKIELFGNNPKTKSTGLQSMLSGGKVTGEVNKADTGWTDEYNAAKSKYDKESSSWNPVEKEKKGKELRTLDVKRHYSKETTSLYDMNETDIYRFLDRQDEKKAQSYYKQIVEYGDKMVEAGLWSTNKLRDKNGNVQYERGYVAKNGKVAKSSGGRKTSSKSTGRKSTGRKSSGGSGGTSNASFAAILAAQKRTNDLANDTYGSLSKLLGGLAPKSQKRTIGQRAVTKKITVKGAKA